MSQRRTHVILAGIAIVTMLSLGALAVAAHGAAQIQSEDFASLIHELAGLLENEPGFAFTIEGEMGRVTIGEGGEELKVLGADYLCVSDPESEDGLGFKCYPFSAISVVEYTSIFALF